MITLYDLYHHGSAGDRSFAQTFADLHQTWEEAQEHWRKTVLFHLHKVKSMEGCSDEEKDRYAEHLAQTQLWFDAKDGVCTAPRKPIKF
ncbi:hypothetical protein OG756_34555 [Streptomyces sp. NBC_01310]|uniref:hypothetical protein n=1 Tax=Streptomyces sp. NBC_01310 TaxID=2903820 RepID=UPI0035B5715F|nr:hypothetical protein OG756_34555 [Streptomyces sp. NBC_01310]